MRRCYESNLYDGPKLLVTEVRGSPFEWIVGITGQSLPVFVLGSK